MGVNKVIYGDETLVDLTGDTVTPQTLAEGTTAHGADGEPIVGTMPTDVVRYGEQTLTDAQKTQARSNIGAIDSSLLENYLPKSGGTMTGELRVNGGDVAGGSKIVLANGKGQITASGTQTLFGFTADSTIAVGHSSFVLAMRGSGARPKYNSKDVALLSDIPTVPSKTDVWTFTYEDGTTETIEVYIK